MTDSLDNHVEAIRMLLNDGRYSLAGKESLTLVEVSMREVYGRDLGRLDSVTRASIVAREQEIGRGKGVESFSLGELVRLFRESKFLRGWSHATGADIRGAELLNWDQLGAIRNPAVHAGAQISRAQAEFLFFCAQSLIETFGLFGVTTSEGAPGGGTPAASTQTGTKPPHPGPPKSTYRLDDPQELARLTTQADMWKQFDDQMVADAIVHLEGTPLVCLDIGCADGGLTYDRLGALPKTATVIGLDKSATAIERATQSIDDGRFSFHQIDLEDPAYERNLAAILNDLGVQPNLAVTFMTLHHLALPVRVLRGLRNHMAPSCSIVVRTVDDGLALAFPDEAQRLGHLLQTSRTVPGTGDREHGRKLAYQLHRAGFRDIDIAYRAGSTVGRTEKERQQLFEVAVSWRRANVIEAIEAAQHGGDSELVNELNVVLDSIQEMELDFEDPGFCFCLFAVGAVAYLRQRADRPRDDSSDPAPSVTD